MPSRSNSALMASHCRRRAPPGRRTRQRRAGRRGTQRRDRGRASRPRYSATSPIRARACSRQTLRRLIGGDQRAGAAAKRDARPPRAVRQRERLARQREAAIRESRPARSRPASPSPPAGPRTDRCAARRARRRAPPTLSRRSSGSARTASRAAGSRSARTRSTPRAVRRRDARELAVARPSDCASSGCISTNGSAMCWPSRGLRPVRVMVCHWSRTRPVLSTNGNSFETLARSAGGSGAMKRALRSGVKKPPSAKKRDSAQRRACAPATANGSSASKASSARSREPPISKSRVPSFSNADSAACSRKISAAD